MLAELTAVLVVSAEPLTLRRTEEVHIIGL